MPENYYNFMNLESYLKKLNLQYPKDIMRWTKDVINTKIEMFYYDNLPAPLTSEILEKSLMFNHFLCFWKSPGLDNVVLCRWRAQSEFDLYWKPYRVTLLTISGKPLAEDVPYEDIVLVRDNVMDIIPFLTLNSWIEKIMEKERTLDILTRLVAFPTILSGDKSQVNELKKLLEKSINFEGFMVAAPKYTDHLEQFDIKLPATLTECYDMLKKYRGLATSAMGIYSVDEKRERIVTSEVQASNDYVDMIYTGMYNERKRFVDECNAKFGTNIVLREIYVDNKEDEMETEQTKIDMETRQAVEIEEVKNAGDVAVAKIEAQAAKEASNNGLQS